ncbi:MAG: cyclase family protein [Steroidobacteraceae bacterium]
MNSISVEIAGRVYRATNTALDISIPLRFDTTQLQAYGAPAAQAETYAIGNFIGDVARGGSCNCQRYHITPHCNGTHTESVGHVTRDAHAVNALAQSGLMLARLITVDPATQASGDRVIRLQDMQSTANPDLTTSALIVRTLPNTTDKLTRNYDAGNPPAYFEPTVLAWLAEIGIEHLLVDVPSVDRMDDGGHLLAHRAFWGLPAGETFAAHAQRPQATITELIYVPTEISDGDYLLSLQLAPFVSDATPSRPLLFPLI